MRKTYDVMDKDCKHYATYKTPTRHQIDTHNNLHLMNDSFEDLIVIKAEQWTWFRINTYDE
jgi:lauroyl/myristoyl acyltransferase